MSNLFANTSKLTEALNNLQDKAAATQQTPVISVFASGNITAVAGDKSASYQMAFQPAVTLNPLEVSQVAVPSAHFTGGDVIINPIVTQTKSVNPGSSAKEITPDAGKYLTKVTVAGDPNLTASNIKDGVTIFGVNGTLTGGGASLTESAFTYSVSDVAGSDYGFIMNSNGYYESQNKGVNYSFALCRVNLNVKATTNIIFDVINYAESNYDYAVFSNIDSALFLNYQADSDAKENFKGRQSASVVNVTYTNVPEGSHFIDIKFIKDQSQHLNNDSVQFKIQPAEQITSQDLINQVVATEPDLIPSNIKSGVDIFGVIGTYSASAGTTTDGGVYQSIYNKTISGSFTDTSTTSVTAGAFYGCSKLVSVSFPLCTNIGLMAFASCTSLKTASFPLCTTIGSSAFEYCKSLTSAYFPKVVYISSKGFSSCSKLTSISFPALTSLYYMGLGGIGASSVYLPKLTYVDMYAFRSCTSLRVLSLPVASYISTYAFENCYRLSQLYLNSTKVCSLTQSSAFNSTPFKGYSTYFSGTPYIYVPSSLLSSYKTASYWSYFSNYFSAI